MLYDSESSFLVRNHVFVVVNIDTNCEVVATQMLAARLRVSAISARLMMCTCPSNQFEKKAY